MLRILFNLQPHKLRAKQVCSFLADFCVKNQFFTTSLESPEPPFSSSVNFSGIAKSVISKCNVHKSEDFSNPSLRNCYLTLSCISPEIIRRFWRVSVLKPQDVFEILLEFQCDSGKYDIEFKKVAALWGIFRWASEHTRDFEHLSESCKIMAKMLVRVGLFEEAECLLSRLDHKGIYMDYQEVFCDLIEGYKNQCDFQKAISKYKQMRWLGIAPSFSCYLLLLELLVIMNETQLAHQIYLDMLHMGMGRSLAQKKNHEHVIRLLCIDGKVQDARNLVKSLLDFEVRPSNLVLDAIVSGYCKKKDYDDILSLFLEVGVSPNVAVGNKVIYSLSTNFGAERANLFMQELVNLGFCPDEVTYGILIGQSCREGRLKSSFIYLSEVLSRNLKPPIYSYNALMSGLFKEGMWKQSCDVFQDMVDAGIEPNLSTFRVLLAGFCKARKFGEVKEIVGQMTDHDLIQSSALEDQLSTALTLLGVCPLAVKVRRDNDIRFSGTEFFDELGNGLYLDTDLDGFDKNMDTVLDDAMIPDFNFHILESCANNINNAVGMVDEMARWGQELSLSSLSTLIQGLTASHSSIKTISCLFEKTYKSLDQLDQGTLNLLIQKYSKRGLTCKAKMILDKMLTMQMQIENETYTALLVGLCKKENLKSLDDSWKLARESNWSPELKDVKALLNCFCKPKLLSFALELLETVLLRNLCNPLDAFHALLEKVCSRGFTSFANVLAEELSKLGLILDEMTYSFLISGFCRELRFSEAFMMFDAMLRKNIVPPVDVALQLIPGLSKVGNIEKAFALQEICLKGQNAAMPSVYCALINVFCKWGRVGEASNLFQELSKEKLQDSESYNILLQGYCQVNNFKKGRELLGVMIRKNLGISVSSYRKLLQLACAAGELAYALSVKELMVVSGSSVPDIVLYNILIFYLSPAKNTIFTDTVVKEIQKKGLQLDRIAHDFIVRGASSHTEVLRSFQCLAAMISSGLRPSDRSLRMVIVRLCSHGDLEKALALGKEMESRGWIHDSVIQNNLFEALLTQGKLPEAIKYLNRLLANCLIPENISYDYQIKRLCQNGELEKASNLLNIMLKKGNAPDSASYDYLIQGFLMIHKFDPSLDFLTEMLQRNLYPSINTWKVLVHGLSEVGKVAEAERLLHLMVKTGEKPSKDMFSCVISKYRSLKNVGKAAEVMQEMQRSGYEPDFETHWSLISNFGHRNSKEDGTKNAGFLSRLLSGIGFAKP